MLNDAPPKVSIIIPVYNPGEELTVAAGSVLGQSYRNLELILVDDGSTDGSSARCHEIAAADERVVVLHQQNGGVSSARNTGIVHATGDYLTFVDADDRLVSGTLGIVVQRLVETEADLAVFGMNFVYHDGLRVAKEVVKTTEADMLLESLAALRDHFFCLYRLNYLSSVCNKVYRTQFLHDNQIQFDEKMAILEDFEFVVSSLARSPRVLVLAEPFYQYRIDLTQHASSRRADIDYLRNFSRLEETLEGFFAVVGFASPADLKRLHAMVFRFYLIGLEMLFAKRMSLSRRFIQAKHYMSYEYFVRAARGSGKTRRGVSIMATLVGNQRVLAVFAILLTRKWAKRSQRRFQVIASRAGLVGPR